MLVKYEDLEKDREEVVLALCAEATDHHELRERMTDALCMPATGGVDLVGAFCLMASVDVPEAALDVIVALCADAAQHTELRDNMVYALSFGPISTDEDDGGEEEAEELDAVAIFGDVSTDAGSKRERSRSPMASR
jgi:hypothetical protein